MSFSSLPEELIDLVASKLREVDWRTAPAEIRRRGIYLDPVYQLALVSRKTLTSARRSLYYMPFDNGYSERGLDFIDAQYLLSTLQANQELGRLVRGTRGVDFAIMTSFNENGPFQDQEDLASGAVESWYFDFLRACPNLQQLDIFLTSDRFLLSMFNAVGSSIATIDEIYLNENRFKSGKIGSPSLSATFDLFRRHFTRPLFGIKIFSTELEEDSADLELPMETQSLLRLGEEVNPSKPRTSVLSFVPSTNAKRPLEILKISLHDEPLERLSHTITRIGSRVGSNLLNLYLGYQAQSDELSSYTLSSTTRTPLSPLFLVFPSLTTLALAGFRGPSLDFLQSLSAKSPLLRQIRLSGSIWISERNPSSTDVNEVFPEHQILVALRNFRFLREVHLGILPCLDRDRYTWLVKEMEKSGITVDFQVCEFE